MNIQKAKIKSSALKRAFTLLEALTVLCVIGVVGSVAYLASSTAVQRAADVKLRADVDALNRAIQIYLANGGDLSTAKDSNDVIARLKTRLNAEDADKFVGLTSSMSDVRIKAIYQTAEEAATDQLRTTWEFDKQRFVLGNAGDAAIKKLVLDDGQATDESEFEERQHSTGFMYAVEDQWIWDFEDRPELAPTEVTKVSIYFQDWGTDYIPPSIDPTGEPDPGPTDPNVDPDPNGPFPLTPPVFTPEGKKYLYTSFPLSVALTENNPEGMAIIRYAINEGSFQTYSGPFTVTHDDVVRAYCASARPVLHSNSVEVDAFYESALELFAGQAGGDWKGGHRDGEIPIRNDSGNGSGFGGGDLDGGGTTSYEYATSANVRYYEEGHGAVFQWGTSASNQPPNSLRFRGLTIINVEPEQLFRLGNLYYYNGAVYSGSEAHTVTLFVDIDMTTPDRQETFPITFDLENTPNNTGNADGNADFVRMQSRTVPMAAKLNGKLYYLVVEFGDVNNNGFSSIDEFHVHENKSAFASLYAYFTEEPPADLQSYVSLHGDENGNDVETAYLTVSDAEATEGGNLSFAATLSNTSVSDTVITFSTENGTASGSQDYIPKQVQTVTIPAGQLSRTITVETVNDNMVELNETLLLNYVVSSGQAVAESTSATGTILNDDNSSVDVAAATEVEGGSLIFMISMSNEVDTDTVISYTTANGTATTSDGDFVGKSNQTLVIPAGQTQGTIVVGSYQDNTVERNETFYLDFVANASGRAVAGSAPSTIGTILNDDSAVLTVADTSDDEGQTLEFDVTLSNPVDIDTVFSYSTANGTATTANNDYSPKVNWSLTFEAGQTSKSIFVTTTSDATVEEDETLRVNYNLQSSTRSVTQASTYATGTLVNNDTSNGGDDGSGDDGSGDDGGNGDGNLPWWWWWWR